MDADSMEVDTIETNPLYDVEALKGCSEERNQDLVKSWLKQEALFKADNEGFNIMHHAATEHDLIYLLKLLIEADRDLISTTTKERMTPLHLAAAEGNPEAVDAILQQTILDEPFRLNLHRESAFYLSIKRNNSVNSFRVMKLLLEAAQGVTSAYRNSDKCYYDLICEYKNCDALSLLFDYDNPLDHFPNLPSSFLRTDWIRGVDLYIKRIQQVSEEYNDRSLKDVVINHYVLSQIIKYSALNCLKLVIEDYGISLLEPTIVAGYFQGQFGDDEFSVSRNLRASKDYQLNLAMSAFRSAPNEQTFSNAAQVLRYILKNVSCDEFNRSHSRYISEKGWRNKKAMMGRSEMACIIHSGDEDDRLYAHNLKGCDICSGSLGTSNEDHFVVFPIHPVAVLRTSPLGCENISDKECDNTNHFEKIDDCEENVAFEEYDSPNVTVLRVEALIALFKEYDWHLNHRAAVITGCLKRSSSTTLSSLEVLYNANMSTLLEIDSRIIGRIVNELILPFINPAELGFHASPRIICSFLSARFAEHQPEHLAERPSLLQNYLDKYCDITFGLCMEEQLFLLIDQLYKKFGLHGVKTMMDGIEVHLPMKYKSIGEDFRTPFHTTFETYVLQKGQWLRKRVTLPVWNLRLLNKLALCGLPFAKLEGPPEQVWGDIHPDAALELSFKGSHPLFLLLPHNSQKYIVNRAESLQRLLDWDSVGNHYCEHVKGLINGNAPSLMQLCRNVLRNMFRVELLAFYRLQDKEPCFDVVLQHQTIPRELTSYIGCCHLMTDYVKLTPS